MVTIMEKRQYGIDLLRITSMLMIVVLHVLLKGGILKTAEPASVQYHLAWILECMCLCSVNCYALISGYVGVDKKQKYYKLGVLWLQVVFYSVIITALFYFTHAAEITIKNLINAVLPVSRKQYWYFTAYFGLFLLMPFLNALVNSLEKRSLKALAVILILLFSVMPTFAMMDLFYVNEGYTLIWLAALYILGGITKKLYEKRSKSNIRMLLYFFAGALFSYITKITIPLLSKITDKIVGVEINSELFTFYNSPSILLCGYALFIIAINSDIKSAAAVKTIKALSPLSFSVYLIHTNPLVFENIIKKRFSVYLSLPPLLLIPAVILTALLIYLACSAMDYIRLCLFKSIHLSEHLETLENNITSRLNKKKEERFEKV